MLAALAPALLAAAWPQAALAQRAAEDEPAAPAGLAFLYGSAEGGAMSRQIYRGLESFVLARVAERPNASVILAEGSTLDAPAYTACGDKPYAVVFDVDETVALNSGLMLGRAAEGAGSPQAVRPVPGVVETIMALRAAGVTPVYNTNRTTDMGELVANTVASFGLERPVVGETLFLNGMDAMGGNKDGRRWRIAEKFCVIAMAGDQVGDFTSLIDEVAPVSARRAAALSGTFASNWGNGWFLLPNTAYGRALEGTLAEVFAPELQASED